MKKSGIIVAVVLLLVSLLVGCGQGAAEIQMPETVPELGSAESLPLPTISEQAVDPAEAAIIVAESRPAGTAEQAADSEHADDTGAKATAPSATPQASEPKQPSAAETTKPTEPKPTQPPKPSEPVKSTEPPKATEPPKSSEPPKPTETPKPSESPKASEPAKPSEPPAQPEPPAPSEAPTQPTEAPTEPPKPEIDIAALEAYGNQYAASLGFQIDYSMTPGNSGYFPPDTWLLESMDEGRRMAKDQVTLTYNSLMGYVGNIDGARCRVIITDNGDGWYTCTALYG